MREFAVETPIHGRVLVEHEGPSRAGLLVVFHGYAQSADDALEEARRIPGSDRWRIAAVQALHRFYTRGEQRVVASWMTRQDRERAIVDNVAYVHQVVEHLAPAAEPIVFAGFSQGASMAYRAAMLGRHAASGIVALAGDVAPELREGAASRTWPRVLIGVGTRETWYTADKLAADVAFLKSAGASVEVIRFDGGHEWTDEFRVHAGELLADVADGPGLKPAE
jgi:predicted esterase